MGKALMNPSFYDKVKTMGLFIEMRARLSN